MTTMTTTTKLTMTMMIKMMMMGDDNVYDTNRIMVPILIPMMLIMLTAMTISAQDKHMRV